MPSIAYIAVHGGAGYHGSESQEEVKRALRRACREALHPILTADTAMDLPKAQSKSKSREYMTTSQFIYPDSASLSAHMDPPPPESDAWDRTSFSGTDFSNCEDRVHSPTLAQSNKSTSNSASALLPEVDGAQGGINDRRRSSMPAIDMVERGIVVLEDDESLNAGYGSNLTIEGTVECDAALVSGKHPLFGSVGAVEGIKNPIALARSILEYSRTSDPLGRIPPLTLVSCGARSFAKSLDDATVICVQPESLVSPRAHRQWEKWTRRLAEARAQGNSGRKMESTTQIASYGMNAKESWVDLNETDETSLMQDTVGAVGWHEEDGFAAGVSSGGLLLKLPGRIGEAAVFGAGCWVKQSSSGKDGVACSVSGTGEYIVRVNLARRLCEALYSTSSIGEERPQAANVPDNHSSSEGDMEIQSESDDDHDLSFAQDAADPHRVIEEVMTKDFWEICRQNNEQDPSVGVLVLKATSSDNGDGGGEPSGECKHPMIPLLWSTSPIFGNDFWSH